MSTKYSILNKYNILYMYIMNSTFDISTAVQSSLKCSNRLFMEYISFDNCNIAI